MKRILIIDDEIYILKSMQRMLEDDFDVTTALGGLAGLDKIKTENQFDLIISDLSMPEVGGIDIYNKTADLFPGMQNHIIFMTGFAYTDELKEFIQRISNSILEKPFRQEDLLAVIDEHLSRN